MTWEAFWIASALHAFVSIVLLSLLVSNCAFVLREGRAGVERSRKFGVFWRSPWLALGLLAGHSHWDASSLIMVFGCIVVLATLIREDREHPTC
jgi:hypothetical protein